MREIKFGVWLTKLQRFANSAKDGMWTINLYDDGSFHIINSKGETIGNDETAILLQYTGLKDKNGKEIYEGDILRLENESGDVGLILIEWYEGEEERCWVGFEGKFVKDITDEIYDEESNVPEGWTGEPEIIGNIYENPKLLEGE